MTTVIKQDGEYSIIKKDAFYEVYQGKEVLKTPNGVVAHTRYLPVAEQLMTDWKEQGYDSYCSPSSLLSYHFTMMEYFASMPKEDIVNMLNSLNWEKGWSFNGCPSPNPHVMMKWMFFFGQRNTKIELVQKWLNNLTHMQLVAATCVYNAFMDFNVSYYMAVVVEDVPEEEQEDAIREFYDFYSLYDDVFDYDSFLAVFERFRLYYGIHFKEDGAHLPQD